MRCLLHARIPCPALLRRSAFFLALQAIIAWQLAIAAPRRKGYAAHAEGGGYSTSVSFVNRSAMAYPRPIASTPRMNAFAGGGRFRGFVAREAPRAWNLSPPWS